MLLNENRSKVQRYFDEVINLGDMDLAEELFSPDYVRSELGLPEGHQGLEVIRTFLRLWRKLSPDAQVVVEELMAAEGNKVVSQWTARGHLADALHNDLSTGDQLIVSGISTFSFSEDGLITSTDEIILSHGVTTPPQSIRDWLLEGPQFHQVTEDEADPWLE